jgi:tetratricopeptide (TPR) repeat protein
MARIAILCATLALLTVVSPAGAQTPQAQVTGQLDGSPSLFVVLSAINAAGYNAEAASPSNSPVREAMRDWIVRKNPASLEELRQFYMAHRKPDPNADLSQYISYALAVDGPPNFKPRFSVNQMPPDAAALEGLTPILVKLYKEADLETAWKRAQPYFDKAIEAYHEPVTEAIQQANLFLRNPTSGFRGRRFQIYVDLLGAPNQVHTRSFGDDYFVVVTSSPDLRTAEIQHAYLHYLLDPLAIRNAQVIDTKRSLGDLAEAAPTLEEVYKTDFVLLTGMCLVKGVEARLNSRNGAQMVEQAMKEGFILTAYFYDALAAYEKQDLALRLYLPKMIEQINLGKEDKRIAQVQFLKERPVKTIRTASPKPPPAPTGVAKELAEAEQLYKERKLEPAKQAFRKIVEQPAPNPVHASAYFSLARIAALENQPELSQQLFERALELNPEPYEAAWSHVYLARLAKAARDPESARKHCQAALSVPEAPEGALKAAKSEMPPAPDTPAGKNPNP